MPSGHLFGSPALACLVLPHAPQLWGFLCWLFLQRSLLRERPEPIFRLSWCKLAAGGAERPAPCRQLSLCCSALMWWERSSAGALCSPSQAGSAWRWNAGGAGWNATGICRYKWPLPGKGCLVPTFGLFQLSFAQPCLCSGRKAVSAWLGSAGGVSFGDSQVLLAFRSCTSLVVPAWQPWDSPASRRAVPWCSSPSS